MKKVLIITYYWPPAGGPGVQRILKFAKYLPEFGWEPIILTVKKGVYTAKDASLEKDVPDGITLFKTACPEPDALYRMFTGSGKDTTAVGVLAQKELNWKQKLAHHIRLNYFIPDAKKFWRSFAVKAGKKIIREYKPDLIISSSPPPTTHLIAMDLAKWSGITWLADFRDPWSRIHYYSNLRTIKVQEKDKDLERLVLKRCHGAVTVSRPFARLLETDTPEKIAIIHNGFDESDFNEQHENQTEIFRITYIGGLNTNRYYPDFFNELERFIADRVGDAAIELTFAGKVDEKILDEIKERFAGYAGVFNFKGYLAHNEAISLMRQSSLLLLFTEKVSHYQGHLPGKLFEYLASGQQVLGVGLPDGEAAKILEQAGQGSILAQDESPYETLVRHFEAWKTKSAKQPDWEYIRQFSRKNLTGKLAALCDALTEQDHV